MEQVASLTALASPARPTEPGPDALDKLLTRAPNSDPHFADAVTRALKELPAYGEAGAASLGKRLVSLLDSGRLSGLVCSDGSLCAVHAAKRLLELGYPWALHLTPQQLEAVRELPGPPKARPRGAAFALSAVAVGLDTFPLFFTWLEWMSEQTLELGGLYRLLSLGAAAVNVLFASGRLSRAKTGAISTVALALSWFGFGVTDRIDTIYWGWLAASWMVTLVASRLARPAE